MSAITSLFKAPPITAPPPTAPVAPITVAAPLAAPIRSGSDTASRQRAKRLAAAKRTGSVAGNILAPLGRKGGGEAGGAQPTSTLG